MTAAALLFAAGSGHFAGKIFSQMSAAAAGQQAGNAAPNAEIYALTLGIPAVALVAGAAWNFYKAMKRMDATKVEAPGREDLARRTRGPRNGLGR